MKERTISRQIQDLSTFKLPAGLRGRPAWFVQIWEITQALFFHSSPHVLYGWRRFLLRLFGARIGKCVMLRPSVTVTYPWKLSISDWSWIGEHVTLYTVGDITIGENVVVSQHSYLCTSTHDCARTTFDTLVAPIHVESEAWLASNVFVGPGVTVGRGAVVGACSVVMKDVPEGMVCVGNPLKILRRRTEVHL